MMNISFVIPAFKSMSIFNNDLLIKVSGKAVIEHLLDKCESAALGGGVYVVTDNEEVDLLCYRKGIKSTFYKPIEDLKFNFDCLKLLESTIGLDKVNSDIALVSPYALFFDVETLKQARKLLENDNYVRPVSKFEGEIFCKSDHFSTDGYLGSKDCYKILNSFILASAGLARDNCSQINYIVDNAIDFELTTRHDLWIYERYINRKRIVFSVAASKSIGMGHVYRALSLAHEIIEHEVVFVCDKDSSLAVIALSDHEYPVYVSEKDSLDACIKGLNPNLVINDFLDTTSKYVNSLKSQGIKVINFEDFGCGAICSDYTINDLYDEPTYQSSNTLWGHEYFFVRDEFYSAKVHGLDNEVKGILLTFGGTDQNDFTRKFYHAIKETCKVEKIKIFIITGDGYSNLELLKQEISNLPFEEVEFIHKTGVMSKVMEEVQLAISSNGRTVYELAHMNIPAIVVSHHVRESNHKFSCFENGFVNLGVYKSGLTEKKMLSELSQMIKDNSYRKKLINSMMKFSFVQNKQKINKLIQSLIELK